MSKLLQLRKQSPAIHYNSIKIREDDEDVQSDFIAKRIVKGYACIWSSRNSHGEMFLNGSFTRSIRDMGPGSNANYEIKFRDQHGKSCSLFAVLKEDAKGLYFETLPLDPVSWCDELLIQIESRTINNFSIGFKPIWDSAKYDDSTDTVIYAEAKLMELSAVSIPSDVETYAIRSEEEIEELNCEIERVIMELPRKKQLETRKLFARLQSLVTEESHAQMRAALKETKPKETGIDYNYLISKL